MNYRAVRCVSLSILLMASSNMQSSCAAQQCAQMKEMTIQWGKNKLFVALSVAAALSLICLAYKNKTVLSNVPIAALGRVRGRESSVVPQVRELKKYSPDVADVERRGEFLIKMAQEKPL